MSELIKRLDKLVLRLDHMGMRVEQSVIDSIHAVREGNEQMARDVEAGDAVIDREEVEIEQECVRLLALYQPAATDLRMICTVIKVNSDLERVADLAVRVARRVRHVVADEINLDDTPGFNQLAQVTLDILGKTVRMLSVSDTSTAKTIIESDAIINRAYKRFVRSVLDVEDQRVGGAEAALTLITLARALERIGDHCTNIAEDIIFVRTGDIVRHSSAFEE